MTQDEEDLIEAEIPSLRRYARALVRDPAEADDLVQDCLERVLSRWRQRRSSEPVRPWLFSIMHNQFVDQTRRRSRRGTMVALDEAVLPLQARQEDDLACRDMLRLLQDLPPDYRSVLLLVGVEGFSYGEAARILGCPEGTVMSRLHRGRVMFRRLLDVPGRPALRRVK
ncbi:MAG: RNA polymerase sigma factor [Alsobacter sp.]